jgi:DNA repair exonuclease SbcCD ATPase subunit
MEGLRPEVDELDRFKHRAAPAAKDTPKKVKSKKADTPPPPRGSSGAGGSSKSGFSIFMVLLMTAGFSVFGWYAWQQQQEIDRLNTRLGDASGFMDQSKLLIARLEGKLSETGEVLAETGTSAEKKLAFLDTEMRKLWGVSNDRNKKAIEANQSALSALENQLASLQKNYIAETKSLKHDLAGISGELQNVLKEATTLANEFSVMRAEQEAINSGLKNQLAQQKQLIDGFKGDTRTYLERLAKVDLSLESINASRRQLNERVVDLDKKVNEVLLKLSAPKP